MASLNYLYLKVTRCSTCTLPRSVQAEQGRKFMRKRARKRSNYAPELTQFFGKAHPWLTSFTCNNYYYECRTWAGKALGRSLDEGPEQAKATEEPHHCTTQWHANGLLVKNPTDQFVTEEWMLKVKVFSSPALSKTASLSALLVPLKSSDISKHEGKWHDWTSKE